MDLAYWWYCISSCESLWQHRRRHSHFHVSKNKLCRKQTSFHMLYLFIIRTFLNHCFISPLVWFSPEKGRHRASNDLLIINIFFTARVFCAKRIYPSLLFVGTSIKSEGRDWSFNNLRYVWIVFESSFKYMFGFKIQNFCFKYFLKNTHVSYY